MTVLVAVVVGVVAAWALTVPLFRFKEFRPKTPRDVQNEAGDDIRAEVRHAICPGCHHPATAADVVPVVSWVRGCPGCGRRLPAVAVALQVGLPVAMAITAATFASNPWVAVPYLWFTVVVAAVAVVDARIWLIPWWMPWVGSAVGGLLILVSSLALGETAHLVDAAVGAAGAFLLFFVMWFVAPGKLGFGDVRLAFMIGLFLGWWSPILALYGLLLGSLVGVVVGVVSLLARAGSRFAFGPALAAGSLLAVWLHASLVP
jgi:leader peptidase (prepilin peptidase) / N-methyltransferase